MRSKPIGTALAVLATAAILFATLYPTGGPPRSGWSFRFAVGAGSADEIVQNLLLFIPLGAALTLTGVRPLVAIALGTALSLSVELAQQWIPGRDPILEDVLCNAASTAAGVGLVRSAPHWLVVPPPQAAWQSLVAAMAAAALWIGMGLALSPGDTLDHGWRLIFFSRRIPPWADRLLDIGWIAIPWLAVAFWTRRHPASAAAIAILTIATLAGPHLARVPPNPRFEIPAAIAGLVIGVVLQRRIGGAADPPRKFDRA